MDTILWLIRVAGMSLGPALAARGIGDEALWSEVAGATAFVASAVWSYLARQQAVATVPPAVRAELEGLRRLAEAVRP